MTILIDTNVKIMATANQDYKYFGESTFFWKKKNGSWIELHMQILYVFNICLWTIVNTHSQHAL